ncbi:hypothetical protein C7B61_02345, partial [filamentous cyanobacterium CCP1]
VFYKMVMGCINSISWLFVWQFPKLLPQNFKVKLLLNLTSYNRRNEPELTTYFLTLRTVDRTFKESIFWLNH